MLAVRDGQWKLLLNPDRSRVELYDIPHDPTQLANLADKHPEVVQRLASEVLAWQKELPPAHWTPGPDKTTTRGRSRIPNRRINPTVMAQGCS